MGYHESECNVAVGLCRVFDHILATAHGADCPAPPWRNPRSATRWKDLKKEKSIVKEHGYGHSALPLRKELRNANYRIMVPWRYEFQYINWTFPVVLSERV
jgi:hypothetical protein